MTVTRSSDPSPPPALGLAVDRATTGVTHIRAIGALRTDTRDSFKAFVLRELEHDRLIRITMPKYVIDLAQLGEFDMNGIGVLLVVAKKVREAGGVVHLAGVQEDLATTFRLTKLDEVFSIDVRPAGTNG